MIGNYFGGLSVNDVLFKNRVVIINEPINDNNASIIVQKIIILNNTSKEDIYILLDSPGGQVTSCFAIYDTIRWCTCDVNTVCLEKTSAFATLLLSSGTKGKRYAFNNSLITPTLYIGAGKAEGIYSEMAKQLNSIIDKTIEIFAINTGNDIEIMKSACMVEHTLTSHDAKEKGFIDCIINENIISKSRFPLNPFIKLHNAKYSILNVLKQNRI